VPLSENINTYSDVKPILDAALKSNGGVYRLASFNDAIRWRQRAYKFRLLVQRRATREMNIAGAEGSTPYDTMILRIAGTRPEVIIEFQAPRGEFVPNEEPATPSTVLDEDALLAAARRLAGEEE
jgi:hypothetical protein